MDSEVNSIALDAFDCDNLSIEDCQYILRSLEKRAFEHVVCALRAQGPLTEYKEVILDHLKALLFISDDDYLMHLRLCANDAVLSKIAERLNPSYDCSSEWLASGYDVMLLDLPKTIQLNTDAPNRDSLSMAEKMRQQMAQHNSRLEEECQATLKLLRLTKRPFVPEKLRRLLQDTEHDINGRVDVAKDKAKHVSAKSSNRVVGRPPRRFENAIDVKSGRRSMDSTTKAKFTLKSSLKTAADKDVPLSAAATQKLENGVSPADISGHSVEAAGDGSQPAPIKTASKPTSRSTKLSKQTNKPSTVEESSIDGAPTDFVNSTFAVFQPGPSIASSVPTKADVPMQHKGSPMAANGVSVTQKSIVKMEEIENQNVAVGEFSIHYSGGANVVVLDPEDQSATKEPKMRKRRSKIIDDVTYTCARVHPFIFEPTIGDMPKPPRGNPDKRCSKLKASKRAQNNNDLNLFNYLPQQSMSGNYYPQKSVSYYNSAPASDIHPLKRSRTTSIPDESNLIYQKPVHHSRMMGTPLNVMTTPTYSGCTPRSSYYGGGPQTPIVVGGPSATSAYTSSSNEYGQATVYSNNDHYYSSGAPPQNRSVSSAVGMVVGGSHQANPADVVIAGYAPARSDMIVDDRYGVVGGARGVAGVEQVVYAKSNRPVHSNSAPVKQSYRRYAPRETVESMSTQQHQHSSTSAAIVDSSVPASGVSSAVLLQPAGQLPMASAGATESKAAASSGLEFLASTASLLVPMQTTESQQPDPSQRTSYYIGIPESSSTVQQHQQHHSGPVFAVSAGSAVSQTPQQIIYVQNPASSTSSLSADIGGGVVESVPSAQSATVAITYYSAGTTAPQASSVLSAAHDGNFQKQPPTTWITQVSTIAQGNVFTTTAASGPSESVADPSLSTFHSGTATSFVAIPAIGSSVSSSTTAQSQQQPRFANEEATQNFLKQSLVDTNGLPLNEQLTLGSIIRSSNLRNKLFSTAAASKSSASPSPNANSPSAGAFTSAPSQLATTTFSVGGGDSDSSAAAANNENLAGRLNCGADSLQPVPVATTSTINTAPSCANRPN